MSALDPAGKVPGPVARTIRTAVAKGKVHRAGGFNGGSSQDAWDKPGFDRPLAVDRCIAAGWLAPTEAWNTYSPTQKGREAHEVIERVRAERMAARKEKKRRAQK